MIIIKEIILQIFREFEKLGIESIDEAIKHTDKNDIAYICPQREIKFKGHSIVHDVINKNLRISSNDINTVGLKKITYSKRFSKLTFHYQDGKKIEKEGDEVMFNLMSLNGDELFRVLNF